MNNTIVRDFFKNAIEECKKSVICKIPYSKTNPITEIQEEAFYDWESCEYVVIPPTVHKIAPNAFHWDKIKLIISETPLPKEYKGIVLPYSEYSQAILNMLQQVEAIDRKIDIHSEDLNRRREEINNHINEILQAMAEKEQDLTGKEQDLQELVQKLNVVLEQSQGLSDTLLNQIEKETSDRIQATLKVLDEHDQKVKDQIKDIETAARQGTASMEEAYHQAQKGAEHLTDETIRTITKTVQEKQREAKEIKQKLSDMLDQLSVREEELTEAVVDRAVERVREENPYKNINIYINNVIQGTAHRKLVHKSFESVVKILGLHLHPLLVGPAGCGKNVMLEQASDALGLKFHYVNDVTEEHKVMGFVDANGKFQKTQFFQAFTEGGLMMIDEIDNSHPSALLAINAALGTGFNQYLAFPDGNLYPCHKDFYCAAAANTYGTGSDMIYCGRSALDGASLNRFVPIFIDYDKDLEEHLVRNTKILPLYWQVRSSIQKNKIRHVISTRNIVNADKMISSDIFSTGQIFDMTIIQSLTNDDLRIILNDIVKGPSDPVISSFINYLQTNKGISYKEYSENNYSQGRQKTYSSGYGYSPYSEDY